MDTLCLLFPVDELPDRHVTLDYWGTMVVFECRGPEFTITRDALVEHPEAWLGRMGCFCYARKPESA